MAVEAALGCGFDVNREIAACECDREQVGRFRGGAHVNSRCGGKSGGCEVWWSCGWSIRSVDEHDGDDDHSNAGRK